MHVEVRTARPNDRGPIAELMYISSTLVYDYLHGEHAVAFLRHELASGVGFAGHGSVTVAVLCGEIVGTACFYDRAAHRRYTRESAGNVLRFYGPRRALPVLWRARHVTSAMRCPEPGELYLSNLCVVPRMRNRGIGSRLIERKLEEARRQGYRTFGLDVSVANPRAQALCRRLGLQVKRKRDFSDWRAPVPPARTMQLAL